MMKSYKYIGLGSALIFVILMFVEVGYQGFFFKSWHLVFFVFTAYLAITCALYATNGNWKNSLINSLKTTAVITILGVIVGLLKRI
jgi:hypothetical protein